MPEFGGPVCSYTDIVEGLQVNTEDIVYNIERFREVLSHLSFDAIQVPTSLNMPDNISIGSGSALANALSVGDLYIYDKRYVISPRIMGHIGMECFYYGPKGVRSTHFYSYDLNLYERITHEVAAALREFAVGTFIIIDNIGIAQVKELWPEGVLKCSLVGLGDFGETVIALPDNCTNLLCSIQVSQAYQGKVINSADYMAEFC